MGLTTLNYRATKDYQFMHFERREEFSIDSNTNANIQVLLQACFPDYPSHQTYFKQVPQSRILVWEKEELIGHASLEYRKIKVGEKVMKAFLIGDICVHPTFQNKKIASNIIAQIDTLAKENDLNLLVVTASNIALYKRNGFSSVDNICRWVILQSHSTLGVRERQLNNSLMVKTLGQTKWNEGTIDFMGHIV